ncbi:hypothetical protein HK405_006539, partial [Cladochytrium tenue]
TAARDKQEQRTANTAHSAQTASATSASAGLGGDPDSAQALGTSLHPAAVAAAAAAVADRLERGRRGYHLKQQRRAAELTQLQEAHVGLARDVGELKGRLAAAGCARQGWLASEVVYLKR